MADTQRLALEAIAAMDTETASPKEALVMCVTIARVELANDFAGMFKAIPSTTPGCDICGDGAVDSGLCPVCEELSEEYES